MQELTPEERQAILNWHPNALPTEDNRCILKLIKYMTDIEIYMVCYRAWSEPFTKGLWLIEREHDIIFVRKPKDEIAYHINTNTGNVHAYFDGRLTPETNNINVTLFYMKHNIAFPVFFEKGHWANGKMPFELGVAIPDKQHLMDALNILYNKDQSQIDQWFFDKKLYNIDLTDIKVFEKELTQINNSIMDKR